MWLLEITDSGFFLTDFLDSNAIPPYAILSHTWGRDSDEVTYSDMRGGTAQDKSGYAKLEFCAEQAKRDGLRFFWVDTCCIDKLNLPELSRSIVSMFRWYQRANRCYVYLSDVSATTSGSGQPQASWEDSFRRSRWFTRGWTLQELLAPSSVEFFSCDGIRLGDKMSLVQQVHEITGIHLTAIKGDKLSAFGVEDRFAWSASRKTRETEDIVYCLLGIFGVSMSIIYGEGEDNARRRLEHEIASKNSAPTTSGKKKRPFVVAFERNPAFAGRETELKKLRCMPAPTQQTAKLAIAGLGGVGKTQLALEFVFQSQKEFSDCAVFWVPSVSQEMIGQAFLKIAEQLGLDTLGVTQAKIQDLLRDYWSSAESGRWILVFDNVDDDSIWEKCGLINCLPRNDLGTIVITTRNRQVAVHLAGPNVIDLSNMDEASSRQLLRNYLVSKDLLDRTEDANVLMNQLAHLPLALVQAATYINMNSITIAEYMALLSEQEEDMVELLSADFDDAWRYKGTRNPVLVTWLISFTQIQERSPFAAQYLSLMACFDSKDIPRCLLPRGRSRKEEIDAIGTLKAYSFVSRQAHNDMLTMHPLVHVATRNWLRRKGTLGSWADKAINILVGALSDPKKVTLWHACMPHAYYQLQLSGDVLECDSSVFKLRMRYIHCLQWHLRLEEAGGMQVQMLNRLKAVKGADDIQTLDCMKDLAYTYRMQDRFDEAEALLKQRTESLLAKLGPEDPDTLRSLIDTASVHIKQRRFNEAEVGLLQAFESCKKTIGPDNDITLGCMKYLSKLYSNQRRLDEAKEISMQVLECRKRLSGSNSAATAGALSDLGKVYYRQGRLENAEELQLHALETCKEVFGPGHLKTIRVMLQLIFIYMDQGRLEDAEELALQAREIGEMGWEVNVSLLLARIRKKQGLLKEAVDRMRDAHKEWQRNFGASHGLSVQIQGFLTEWEAELGESS